MLGERTRTRLQRLSHVDRHRHPDGDVAAARSHADLAAGLVWMACYVAFIVFFYLHDRVISASVRCPAQSILAVICCFLKPNGFQPILLVIVAAQLAAAAAALWPSRGSWRSRSR